MQRDDSGGGAETVHDRAIFLPEQGAAIDALLARSFFAREGYGHAISFDGDDDYVSVPDSSSLHIANTLTIEVWVKPSEVKTSRIISKRDE